MNYLLIVLQIANFSEITHSPTFGRAFTHENEKLWISRKSYFFCFNARREIHTAAVVLTKIFVSPKMVAILNFQSFCKTRLYAAYISKTVLYGANSTKFWTCWVSLQSSHANFQNIFVSPNIADIFNFFIFCKTQKCLYLENRAR